jgi:hypothetical protein
MLAPKEKAPAKAGAFFLIAVLVYFNSIIFLVMLKLSVVRR